MDPKGPGRASKGSREAFRFIWTKFEPKWAHLGPIRAPVCFSIAQKPILGPNSSKSIIPNEVLGPWDPGWGERAAPGSRRPTFRRGVGGRQPPHRKGALGAIANSEIRNPVVGTSKNPVAFSRLTLSQFRLVSSTHSEQLQNTHNLREFVKNFRHPDSGT